MKKGDTKEVLMPRHTYIKVIPGGSATEKETGKKMMLARLLLTPWNF